MTATKYLTLFFLSFILLSCQDNEPYVMGSVHVKIQNATTTQPIAVRLTDECWETINPINTYTFHDVGSFSNTVLVAFTEDDSPEAYNEARYSTEYRGCSDAQVNPPYNLLKDFAFSTEILVYDKDAEIPTITIIAEEIEERASGNSSGIAKVRFRVLEN